MDIQSKFQLVRDVLLLDLGEERKRKVRAGVAS